MLHGDMQRPAEMTDPRRSRSNKTVIFGVQGWTWGEQRPTSVTFFLDGTVKVQDQHGRPIKGTVKDSKVIYFDKSTHAQVVAALADERIDWQSLVWAGWPQLPYEQLQGVRNLPPTPAVELKKIPNKSHRQDALKMRAEMDAVRDQELAAAESEG